MSVTIEDGTSMAFPSLLSLGFATSEVVARLERAICASAAA